MEAIFADRVFFVIFVGQTIHESLGGHGLVESSVEYDNHRDIVTDNFTAGTQGQNMCGIVQRRERRQLFDLVDDLVGCDNRFAEDITPWTTRWPTAEISETESTTFPSPLVNFSITFSNASVWVGKLQSSVTE